MNKKLGIGITVVVVIVAVAMFAGGIEREAPPLTSKPLPSSPDVTSVYGYEIINAYPHDRNAFTQGLVFDDGVLYEGTGIRGESTLRKLELETGEVL